MMFFVGLHQPSHAQHFDRAFISINRLRTRRSCFPAHRWILDSGAFTTVSKHGTYPEPVAMYAAQVQQWSACGTMLCAVAQDYMCEPFVLARTGLTIPVHQQLTIERYQELRTLVPPTITIMPVLQGFTPSDYRRHIQMYGGLLQEGQWVGVGSVCKRNARPQEVLAILQTIKHIRPDLCLHGFGLKTTTLAEPAIRTLLTSADSMAWSFAARREGRGPDANRWQEAKRFEERIERLCQSHICAEE